MSGSAGYELIRYAAFTMRIARTLLLVLLTACGLGCPTTGQEAFESMESDQRSFATDVLSQIQVGATPDEVSSVLGDPYRKTPGKLYWRRPAAGERERVDGYFVKGKLFQMRYANSDPLWIWNVPLAGDD